MKWRGKNSNVLKVFGWPEYMHTNTLASSSKSSICLCWYGGPERSNALQLKKQKIKKHCKIRQNTTEMERKLSKNHETK